MLLLVISFLLTGMVRADEVGVDDGVKKVEDADSGVLREMEQLRFKISSLGTHTSSSLNSRDDSCVVGFFLG